MKKQIIAVTEYPVESVDSVRFLSNVQTSGGMYKLQLTKNPAGAARYGAEIVAVVEWLNKLSGEKRIVQPKGFGYNLSFINTDIK